MATKTGPSGFGSAGALNQTQTLVLTRASTDSGKLAQRNVVRTPTTVYGILVDNQEAESGNTKVWIKVYDDVSDSWNPGTTKAIMGFPIEQRTAAADDLARRKRIGLSKPR